MASSVIRAVAYSSVLGASAVALSRQPEEAPRVADLERWAHGPLFSKNGSLLHALVGSRRGDYLLTIASYDRWSDQGVSGGLLSGKGWEQDHITDLCNRYRDLAGEAGNFLDVGANIGTFTIPMADCLKFHGGKVIAVEGMPPIADHLAVGILANNLQNVDMYMYAVGAPDDPKKVTMSLNPVNKGGSAVKGNKPFTEMSDQELQDLFHPGKKQQTGPKVTVEEYEVPLTTGDAMLEHNPALKAVLIAKVDIEGHEGHFIKGSQRLFSQYPPCVLTIELIPDWLEHAGTPVEEILDLLTKWGYSDVPTAAYLRKTSEQGRTRTIAQSDLAACVERVRAHAAESRMPEPDYSDPAALSAVLAREARAKELDAMLAPAMWKTKVEDEHTESSA